jgi:hypothetical protein
MTIFFLNISLFSKSPHIHSYLFSLDVLSSLMSLLVNLIHPFTAYKHTTAWIWIRVHSDVFLLFLHRGPSEVIGHCAVIWIIIFSEWNGFSTGPCSPGSVHCVARAECSSSVE